MQGEFDKISGAVSRYSVQSYLFDICFQVDRYSLFCTMYANVVTLS